MRFDCPHCHEPASRPVVKVGDAWIEDTDPDVHSGSTWYCSECHRPVVIEPQTPEERRDNFIARVKWLESNTKMDVVELQPLRCCRCLRELSSHQCVSMRCQNTPGHPACGPDNYSCCGLMPYHWRSDGVLAPGPFEFISDP